MAAAVDLDGMVEWIRVIAERIEQQRALLTRLDSEIGDADHGTNLTRGFRAAVEKLQAEPPPDLPAVLTAVGMTLVSKVGGASGPLYGTMFLEMGRAAGGKSHLGLAEWSEVFEAGVAGVQRRGKAEEGDKTMVDALAPAHRALSEAARNGAGWARALERSAEAARRGMEETIPLVARKGRASYLGERSAGHQDPGATSTHLLLQAAADVWAGRDREED